MERFESVIIEIVEELKTEWGLDRLDAIDVELIDGETYRERFSGPGNFGLWW